MERSHRLIVVVLAIVVTIPLFIKSRQVRSYSRTSTVFSVYSTQQSFVRISGDVRHPGMYNISANKMTIDAIKMAIPFESLDNLDTSPYAADVVKAGDDLHLQIDRKKKILITKGRIPVSQCLVMGIALDITTMNEADFDKLPGIGPVLAKRIVEYRQKHGGFMQVKDLLLVDGIGEKQYEKLKKYF